MTLEKETSINPNITFQYADDTVVYPGHDYNGFTTSTIGEKGLNPRLRNSKPNKYFREIMGTMELPKPKKVDIAVPGNIACGLD